MRTPPTQIYGLGYTVPMEHDQSYKLLFSHAEVETARAAGGETRGVAGAAGRMGRAIVEACRALEESVILTAAIEREGSPAIGADVGELAGIGPLGVKVTDRLAALTEAFDVLIDFSQPEATLAHLAICRQAKRRMVIGTTGIAVEGRAMI